jgi:nucleotide-binding universal stress UspA family protein
VARRFDATLHLLHAMELPLKAEMLEPTDGPYGEIQATLQDRLHQNLTDLASVVAKDLRVRVDLAPGPAAEILPFYIRQQKADLLVVGVRSRRRLQQLLIGSTTEAALRHAPCAVLTVPTTMTCEAVPGKISPC